MNLRTGTRIGDEARADRSGKTRRQMATKRVLGSLLGFVVAAAVTLGVTSSAQAAPVQFFYVPFPEDQVLQMMVDVESGGSGDTPSSPVTSYITITAVGDNTIIYYDQWENGYDVDLANTLDVYNASTNQDGTQIWGDGNTANGAPPGISSDIINAGTVIQLENTVNTSTRQTVIDFDGGDKIGADKTIALTRTTWSTGPGTLFAGCVEVFDTNNWGTEYRAPVGENIPDSGGTPDQGDAQMFEYTALTIMAGEDGTTVDVDANADGDLDDADDENDYELDEGENFYVTNVNYGARVTSNRPVQVDIFSGDVSSNYESRDSGLIPVDKWTSRYYTPVSTPPGSTGDARTSVWLYNPDSSSITVTYQRRDAAGNLTTSNITVPGAANSGGYYKQILENPTNGTGATFYTSGAPFYAYSTTDSASTTTTNNQAWDWSFTMIPEDMLTTQALIGLGIGRDPTSTSSPLQNGNPVWVTTKGNGNTAAPVYVDYDGDPTTGLYSDPQGNGYDAVYNLRELDQAKVYVPGLEVDATSSYDTDDSGADRMDDQLTVAHTTGSEPYRLMLVSVSVGNDQYDQYDVSSVTYGGTDLEFVGRVIAPTGGAGTPDPLPQTEIWALADPPSGTGNVVVTLAGERTFGVGVTTFSGVDISDGLDSALGSYYSNSANTGAQTLAVSTTRGQLVYDAVAVMRVGGTSPADLTVGAGQTQLWQRGHRSEEGTTDRRVRAASSYEIATGTSTTMSWGGNTGYPWAIGAVPVNPAYPRAQTGILIYTLGTDPVNNPDTDTKLAVAWGQDPTAATAGAPGLDVGTSVPPMPEFQAGKDGTLYDDPSTPGEIDGDNDDDGYLSPGDEMVYPITVYNVSRLPVPNVYIWDHSPDSTLYDTTYVEDSTVLRKDTDGDGTWDSTTAIPDDTSGTPFPLDNDNGTDPDGYYVGTLPVNGIFEITFHVILDEYEDLIPDTLAILNGGKATALGWDDPVDDDAYLKGRISDYCWVDLDADGLQEVGEEGVAGITVNLLYGSGLNAGNPVLDSSGDPMTVVTGADGLYQFLGLPADDYIVEFVIPTGSELSFTDADQGSDDAVDSDADETTGRTGVITLGGGQKYYDADAGFEDPTPTLAVIGSFKAYKSGGKVVLAWETTSEAGTAGFYLERLVGKTGQWVTVNQEIVPALFESPSGGSYTLVDAGAKAGSSLSYRLVELETSGETVVHGPYEVKADASLPSGQASSEIAQGKQSARVPKIAKARERQAAPGAKRGVDREKASANRLRIEVVAPGLYVISASEIATGLSVTTEKAAQLIADGRVRLTSQGRDVAYLPATDGSGLYFYGQAIDSIYTSSNVYWLAQGKGTVIPVPEATALETQPVETTTTTSVPAETTTTATLPVETTTTTTVPVETTTSASLLEETITSDAPPAETTTSDTAPADTTTSDTVPGEAAAAETTTTSEVAAVSEAITSFVDTLHVEQDLFGAPPLFHDPEGDYWLWLYLVAGNPSLGNSTVAFEAPYALAGVELSVQLQGLNTQDIADEHLVEGRLNGVTLGRTSWSGTVVHRASFELPEGLLRAGQNTLEFIALRNAGVKLSVVGVDSIDLTYERMTTATSGQLELTSPVTGAVKIDGLSGIDAMVLDIGTPSAPRALPVASAGAETGGSWVTFAATEGGKYLVSIAAGALHPQQIAATTGTALRSKLSADYVIVTDSALSSAAASLAQYRAGRGHKTIVVTLNEIYDEFNYGIADPHAIQSFLQSALSRWQVKPKYLVLAGEGSYDYKDNMGFGECIVPSLMIDTEYGLASSDVLLGDVKGSDGVPEVAVGRIIAMNTDELTAAVNKIKSYEASKGAWRKSVLFVADNGDDGGDFSADSNSLASVLPSSLAVKKAYLDDMPVGDLRAALLPGFTSGSLWINYVGHGGTDRLAEEGILTRSDVDTLTASGFQLPVVTAFTCMAGSYNLPAYSGLGETLVKKPTAGAIAVWAPSAMEEDAHSVLLGSLAMRQVFRSSGAVVLGDRILAAQKAAPRAGVPIEVIRTYNLLGDPALRLSW